MDTDATFAATAAAYRRSQILYGFAKLGIAELVSGGVNSVETLARSVGADQVALWTP